MDDIGCGQWVTASRPHCLSTAGGKQGRVYALLAAPMLVPPQPRPFLVKPSHMPYLGPL